MFFIVYFIELTTPFEMHLVAWIIAIQESVSEDADRCRLNLKGFTTTIPSGPFALDTSTEMASCRACCAPVVHCIEITPFGIPTARTCTSTCFSEILQHMLCHLLFATKTRAL